MCFMLHTAASSWYELVRGLMQAPGRLTLPAGLVMMDLAGAVLGWRFMDHFGHLGGALAGYW